MEPSVSHVHFQKFLLQSGNTTVLGAIFSERCFPKYFPPIIVLRYVIQISSRGKVVDTFWKERPKDRVGDIFIEILSIKSSNNVYEMQGFQQDMPKSKQFGSTQKNKHWP